MLLRVALFYSFFMTVIFHYWNITKAEEIKKRWREYTEELYKNGLNDPDNHDGVDSHVEPDSLKCEVKWALGSITKNKAS